MTKFAIIVALTFLITALALAQPQTSALINQQLDKPVKLELNNVLPEAMRKIAQYVLAPVAVRLGIPFDRWHASDTWIPGTPTGW